MLKFPKDGKILVKPHLDIDPKTSDIYNIYTCELEPTYIRKGRRYWKGIAVYHIQMCTNGNWIPRRGYLLHHKNGNKLDDSLDNLVCISRKEHSALHAKGNQYHLGCQHSEETRQSISESMTGNQNAIGNRSQTGKHMYNNGKEQHFFPTKPSGDEWKLGKLKNAANL